MSATRRELAVAAAALAVAAAVACLLHVRRSRKPQLRGGLSEASLHLLQQGRGKLLSKLLDLGGFFGVDIGGSLTKVLFFLPDESVVARMIRRASADPAHAGSWAAKMASVRLIADFMLSRTHFGATGVRDAELSFALPEMGGSFHFVRFETRRIAGALGLARAHGLNAGMRTVCATGGGAHRYRALARSVLGVTLTAVDEIDALVVGVGFLMAHVPAEAYTFHGRAPVDRPMDGVSYPYLLVNVGSGVGFILVTSETSWQRVSGTSIGGGTFYGMCHMLTGVSSFDEMLDLAELGNNANVDLTVGDIYGGDYSAFGLKATTIASSFGKAITWGGSSASDRSDDGDGESGGYGPEFGEGGDSGALLPNGESPSPAAPRQPPPPPSPAPDGIAGGDGRPSPLAVAAPQPRRPPALGAGRAGAAPSPAAPRASLLRVRAASAPEPPPPTTPAAASAVADDAGSYRLIGGLGPRRLDTVRRLPSGDSLADLAPGSGGAGAGTPRAAQSPAPGAADVGGDGGGGAGGSPRRPLAAVADGVASTLKRLLWPPRDEAGGAPARGEAVGLQQRPERATEQATELASEVAAALNAAADGHATRDAMASPTAAAAAAAAAAAEGAAAVIGLSAAADPPRGDGHGGGPPQRYEARDIARSLLIMVSNNIGQLAFLNAVRHKCKHVYFAGNFLRHDNTIAMRTLAYAITFWSKGTMEGLFLRHEGYCGALGAFLATLESTDDTGSTGGSAAATAGDGDRDV